MLDDHPLEFRQFWSALKRLDFRNTLKKSSYIKVNFARHKMGQNMNLNRLFSSNEDDIPSFKIHFLFKGNIGNFHYLVIFTDKWAHRALYC